MSTALERYYQQKAKRESVSPILKRQVAVEVAGVPDIIKKHSPGFFVKLLDILDRPGNATRALLVGKLGGLKGLIPFAQFFEDLTGFDIAMNEDDLVRGTEVIEKFFGKQSQKKGKVDTVDVLGFLVEVFADPLWLVAGPGLTKLAKAKQLVRGSAKGLFKIDPTLTAVQAAKKLAYQKSQYKLVKQAITAAKTGKAFPPGMTKRLVKAYKTVYAKGGSAKMAATWAGQAARGERALLQLGLPFHKKPVIKGVKAFERASKLGTAFKTSKLGKILLSPTRRVSERFEALHDIVVHQARDLPAKQADMLRQEYAKLAKDIEKVANVDEVTAKLSQFIERHWAPEAIETHIKGIKAERLAARTPGITKWGKEIEGYKKKIQTQLRRLEKAEVVPHRPKPVRPPRAARPPAISTRALLTDVNKKISANEIYKATVAQNEQLKSMMGYKFDFGTNYSDVMQYIDPGRGNPRNYLMQYVAKPGETGMAWDSLASEIAPMIGREPITDVTTFIEFLDEVMSGSRMHRGINEGALQRAIQIGDPDLIVLGKKREMILAGERAKRLSKPQPIKIKLKSQGDLGVWDEDTFIPSTVAEEKAILSQVVKGEGQEAADIVKALRSRGIETISTHKTAEGIVVRARNLSKQNRAILEKTKGVQIKQYPKMGGDYITFRKTPKAAGVLTDREIVEGINAEMIDLATGMGGDAAHYTVPLATGKKPKPYKDILNKWRWKKATDQARARIRAAKIKGITSAHQSEIKKRLNLIKRAHKVAASEDIKPIRYARYRQEKLAREADVIAREMGEKIKPKVSAGEEQFRAWAKKIREADVERLKAEKALDVPVSKLDQMLGYQRRMITPEAREFLARKKMTERFLRRGRGLGVRTGAQRRRSARLGHMTKDEVTEIMQEIGFPKDATVFEPSAIASGMTRGLESFRVRGAANAIHKAVKRFAKNDDWLIAAGKVDDAEDLARKFVSVDDFMGRTGLNVKAGAYAGKSLPREVSDALLQMQTLVSSEEALRGFWSGYTDMVRYMKGSFTIPFLGYHGRNMLSNFYLNWIGGVQNPAAYFKAAQLQKAALATKRIMKKQNLLWDDALEQTKQLWPTVKTGFEEIEGWRFYDVADQYGIVGRSLGQMGAEEVVGGAAAVGRQPVTPLTKKVPARIYKHATGQGRGWQAGREVAGTIEDNARLAHFIDKMGGGLDPALAARSTKKVLFDYGDLSQAEKKYLRDRAFFFYTFARKNLPLQIQALAEQPAKQAVLAHLAGGSPVMQKEALSYPEYWQERLVIPTPFRNKEGVRQHVVGTGLPLEEALGPLAGPGVGPVNRLRRIVSRGASRLAPPITTTAEFALKKNLYFDSDIKDWGKWAHQKMPYGRVYGTYRHAMESPDTAGSKALGFTTGMRYKNYDPIQGEEYAARRIARQYLAGQKKIKTFKRYYDPNKDITDEDTLRALELLNK